VLVEVVEESSADTVTVFCRSYSVNIRYRQR